MDPAEQMRAFYLLRKKSLIAYPSGKKVWKPAPCFSLKHRDLSKSDIQNNQKYTEAQIKDISEDISKRVPDAQAEKMIEVRLCEYREFRTSVTLFGVLDHQGVTLM